MEIGPLIHFAVLIFSATVVICAIVFLVVDTFGRVDYLKDKVPWLANALERRSIIGALLMVTGFLLVGDGYELVAKEVPDVAPVRFVFNAPPPPAKIEITRTSIRPEPKQCWLANHFGMPNSTIKGAITATAAIIHCNMKVDGPIQVSVEFDSDFIPGAMVVPDTGGFMGSAFKNGRTFIQSASYSLLSNQLAIVTVYGETSQYPRAVRANVVSLK
jgi:hypothetical protein